MGENLELTINDHPMAPGMIFADHSRALRAQRAQRAQA